VIITRVCDDKAARRYNRKAAGYKLVSIASPTTNGVSLVGSF
jgi:hypothetical protein